MRKIAFWSAAALFGALAVNLSALLGQATTPDKIAFARVVLYCLMAVCVAGAFLERQLDRTIDAVSSELETRFSGKLNFRTSPAKSETVLTGVLFATLAAITVYVLVMGASAVWLAKEDGILEWMTSLFYLAAVVTMMPLIFRAKSLPLFRMHLILLAFLFFFVGMEEISWGQRIFSLSTPEFLKGLNVQDELTLHNIWSISLTTYPALFVVTTLLCFIPYLNRYSPRYGRFFRALQFPVTQLSIAGWFLVVAVAYLLIGFRLGTPTPLPISFHGVMPSADDEILEFFIAFLFYVAAFSQWRVVIEGVPASTGGRETAAGKANA